MTTTPLSCIQASNARIALAKRHALEQLQLKAKHTLERIDAGLDKTPCCDVAYGQRPGDPRGPVKRVDYCPECAAAVLLDGMPVDSSDCPQCQGETYVVATDPRTEVTHTACHSCDYEDIG